MRRTFRTFRVELLGGALALCLVGTTAGAQAVQPDEGVDAGDIVVTAQRRSERLIDVPATVMVLSGDTLAAAAISGTRELAQLVPGIQISNVGAFTSVTVRGVSSETAGPGGENNVATYLDGIYLPTKSSGIFDLPDVDGIEILKGPQGTLYGRNATGGAILINTSDPTFEPRGSVSVSYGSFDEHEFKAAASVPIVPDVLAASISGFYRKSDGYLRSSIDGGRVGGVESGLVRGKLLIVPTEAVQVILSAYYSDRRDEDTMSFTTINGNSNGALYDPNVIVSTRHGFNAANNLNLYHNKTLGLSARAEIETGIGKLSILSGYTDIDAQVITDGDNSSVTGVDYITTQPQKSYSSDVYLASDRFGAVSFLVGASYYKDTGYFDPVRRYTAGVVAYNIYAKIRTEAFAAYVEGNLDVSDRLTITAGARWTTEQKHQYAAFNNPVLPLIGKERWSNVTPRVAIKYELSDDVNVYASYSRGFKSGHLNATAFVEPSPVRPEIVDSFEAGIKMRLSNALSFNASAFYYEYSDIQVTTFRFGSQVLQNAAKARIYGADVDLTYRPVSDLTLRLAVSPLQAEYTSFPNAVILVPTPTANCPAGFVYCGNQNAEADLGGNRLPRAPKLTATGSINYALRTGDQTVMFDANLYYSSKFFWEASNRLAQDNYAVVNGRISWNINNGPFTASLWGRNLTNSKYFSSQGIGLDADGLFSAPPRSWGGRLSVQF